MTSSVVTMELPRFLPSPLLFILPAILGAGCEPGDQAPRGGDLATTFDSIGDVVHVTNAGTPPEWRLAPVASIGPKTLTDQAAPEEFGLVNGVALGPDGNVFVADARNLEIRVFGLDGAHRRTFGRDGEGPGEFRSIYSLAWVGDRLLAMDPRLGRIGEFSAEGEWLGQRRTAGGLSGSPAFMRFYPVGANEAFRFARVADGTALVGHHSRGETGDTVSFLWAPANSPGAIEVIICEAEGVSGFFGHSFAPRFVQHPASGGVMYSGWTYSYRIAVTRSDGDTLRVIERTLPAEPITDEEWAAGSAEFEEFRNRWPDASCNPRGFTRPDRKSFIKQIFVAPDGKLWVEVIRTAGNRWEFFDPEGRLLGSVPAVPHTERTVPVFRGDHLATIRQDELELDHVDVWRLERVGRE